MATKQLMAARHEHTCDGCGVQKRTEQADVPTYWRVLSFPHQDPMINYTLCWSCQEKAEKLVRGMSS